MTDNLVQLRTCPRCAGFIPDTVQFQGQTI